MTQGSGSETSCDSESPFKMARIPAPAGSPFSKQFDIAQVTSSIHPELTLFAVDVNVPTRGAKHVSVNPANLPETSSDRRSRGTPPLECAIIVEMLTGIAHDAHRAVFVPPEDRIVTRLASPVQSLIILHATTHHSYCTKVMNSAGMEIFPLTFGRTPRGRPPDWT